uniref:Defensin-like protein n=1 Tax=Panagrolaimus superbus TaxID=310955 RepID=A0A914YZM6_9BILA
MKFTILIISLFFVLFTSNVVSEESSMMSECSTFCPTFCKGKCDGTQVVTASCDGSQCHCKCSVTTVGCKSVECEKYCKEHSGGRHFEASCSKPHICKCLFGDSTKDMNRVNYPIPKDAHYEVVIKPE